MSLSAPQENLTDGAPDRIVMVLKELRYRDARRLAQAAVENARQLMPRVTGDSARRLQPIYGNGFFGIWFPDSHTWFLERGTKPRTQYSLAGKVIPMWITDTDGSVRRENPKAQTRRTEDGRNQVLIFRRAARIGQRKLNRRVDKTTGQVTTWTTPMSYPGAAGRIGGRDERGRILPGNSGVRWRNPGIKAIGFMNTALAKTAFDYGYFIDTVYVANSGTWDVALKRTKE
jgi:hypothetical protein